MVDPTMYVFVNRGLDMTPGKLAAQVHHAAILGWELTPKDSNLRRLYFRSGHYKTVVLEASDEAHLRNIHDYLTARDVQNVMVIDEGHTEVPLMTPTVIGTEVVDKNHPHISGIFGEFNLYNELSSRQAIALHKAASEALNIPVCGNKMRFFKR
jgi:peptidyl-tRNA hydrolase